MGFSSFRNRGLVGAFCIFGVSDTGNPVQNLGIFAVLGYFWRFRVGIILY